MECCAPLVSTSDVGAGAQLLGGIAVGEHVRIGANAVVLIDVPPHGVAIGVPAVVQEGGR